MIKDFLINSENLDVFSKLIPVEYQNEIKREGLTAFGFYDDEAMAGERIIGVILARRFDRWLEIEYMSQSDLYAGEYYGTEILSHFIGLMGSSSVDYAGCYTTLYPDETESLEIFDRVGFKFSRAKDGIYEFTFDMVDLDSLTGCEKYADKCISLRNADSGLISEVERKLSEDPKAMPLIFPIPTENYDQDMSMIYRDDATCGILLCSLNDDYMMIDVLASQGPKCTGTLLGALFMYYEKHCDPGMTISVPAVNEETKGLIKHVVPAAGQKEINVGCYYF